MGVALSPGVIQLLSHDLDADPRSDGELDALLSTEERARAERFAFPRLRRRYRVGRAVLRCALARSTGLTPAELSLVIGPQGKPALAGGPAFNLSHSEGLLLLGLTLEGRLGVDVEWPRPLDDLEGLARYSFAEDECRAVLALAGEAREQAFLETWTRKEALLKALGGGLSLPLKACSVRLGTPEGSLLTRLELPGEQRADWWLRPVVGLPGGAVAAVALDRQASRLAWLPARYAYV
ncbi:MAG: 4'-phosphopantetheinyl transferase superfamily protein [Gammaproteobacteria bacterium]|nr:4'-phosphopantetheinyl transferase superfamily protein [Gammaproteobacteria bacterium]